MGDLAGEQRLENRRRSRRYPLEIAVRAGEAEGHTQDLSSRGLYFVAPSVLEVGSVIELALTLPHGSLWGPLHLRLRARIMRVDDHGASRGFAGEIVAWDVPASGAPPT